MATVERATSNVGKQYLTQLLSNFQFTGKSGGSLNNFLNGNFGFVGFECNETKTKNVKTKMLIDVYIPSNFVIKESKLIISHFPLKIYNASNVAVGWGYSRKIKAYKATNVQDIYRQYTALSEFEDIETESYIDLNVLGIDGYTPSVPTDGNHILEETISTNLDLASGLNRLKIESSETTPTYTSSFDEANYLNLASKSGMVSVTLNVIGYTK